MAGITFSEGTGLNNSVFGKIQAPVRMFLEKRGEAFEQESIADQIFSTEKSTHWAEHFSSMTAMNGFQPVGENGAHPVDNMQEGFGKTLVNMTWKDSFSISREIMDDATATNLKSRPEKFIAGYYRTREKFAAALLGNAVQGNTSMTFAGEKFDTTSADNVCLFSTAHPSALNASNTQTNCYQDAFSNDALMALETAMQGFKGDNDEILDVAPDTIIIPNDYALKKAVFAAIGADKDPATANNAFNYNFGRWNVIVWPYLNGYIASGTSPWILMDSKFNKTYAGGVWLDRVPLEVRSDIDLNTDANVWRGYARFIAGFNDWRYAAVAGVSGGSTLISE